MCEKLKREKNLKSLFLIKTNKKQTLGHPDEYQHIPHQEFFLQELTQLVPFDNH